MAHYEREPRVHALMIEVRRDLYMDEATGERSKAFEQVRERLTRLLAQLAAV